MNLADNPGRAAPPCRHRWEDYARYEAEDGTVSLEHICQRCGTLRVITVLPDGGRMVRHYPPVGGEPAAAWNRGQRSA